MAKDDVCHCPEGHRLVLDGTCWRCLGRAAEPISSLVGAGSSERVTTS